MSQDLARWRFEKAESAYQEGLILYNADSLSGAVNRFYYAAFHGMRAVLSTKGLDAPKHSGVISIFNKEFVKPGLISKNASKIITIAFSERSNADYNDFKIFQKAEVEKLKKDIKILLDEISNFLNK
jgi:uncharacterized protein (UPF0332 family)